MLFDIDRNFKIQIDNIELKGEFPLPRDDRDIELELAKRLNYIDKNKLNQDIVNFEHICCILNKVIKDKPKFIEDFAEIYDYDWTIRVFN